MAKGGVDNPIRAKLLMLMRRNAVIRDGKPYVLTDAAWDLWAGSAGVRIDDELLQRVFVNPSVKVSDAREIDEIIAARRTVTGLEIEIMGVAFVVICLGYARESEELMTLEAKRQEAINLYIEAQVSAAKTPS